MPRDADIAGQKATLRKRTLARRDALDAGVRERAGRAIVAKLLALDAFAAADVVLAYCGFGSELDTDAFVRATRASGKALALPRIDRAGDRLVLFVVGDVERDLAASAWGIREPIPGSCTPIATTDVGFVLVPGVAFDSRGGRLGHGKAYYDRLLRGCFDAGGEPFVVAGAFEAQIVERVPMEAHDVAIPRIVTETRTIDAAGIASGIARSP